MGEIKATLTLPKNAYKYNEAIYFIMEIDCSKLSIDINGVKISLNVTLKNNDTPNGIDDNNNKKPIEIIMKKIIVDKGKKNYYIDDFIKLPENIYNPETLYKKYDDLKKIIFDNNTFLYQSCYEDILNCQYTIKALIEINSMFSTNEFIEIPIDFYEDITDNNDSKNKIILKNEDNDLPTLEEIIEEKKQNEIMNNGYYNINYVENPNYFNNNEKENENINDNQNNDNENSEAPPSFGEAMDNNIK